MCIMAAPVASVTDTKIYVGRDALSQRQLTVYEMSVQLRSRSGKGNAMILPAPIWDDSDQIDLYDLSGVPDFFEPLTEVFTERTRSLTMSKGLDLGHVLEVHRVGSYDVSIVPTVDDVKRLNTNVFDLSADTEHTLRSQYPVGYQFVVAQLRESGKFHPLAYSHPYVDGLFIPTRHEHGRVGMEELPKWDHQIFYMGLPVPVTQQVRHERNSAFTRSVGQRPTTQTVVALRDSVKGHAPALLDYIDLPDQGRPLNCIFAKGRFPNVDIFLAGAG
jgi:hypothetical protein